MDWRAALPVADLFHALDDVPVAMFLNGDMRHTCGSVVSPAARQRRPPAGAYSQGSSAKGLLNFLSAVTVTPNRVPDPFLPLVKMCGLSWHL
jgi:hypothetical protein